VLVEFVPESQFHLQSKAVSVGSENLGKEGALLGYCRPPSPASLQAGTSVPQRKPQLDEGHMYVCVQPTTGGERTRPVRSDGLEIGRRRMRTFRD
jgi:hypothetical protein